jgi:hypothetical protein
MPHRGEHQAGQVVEGLTRFNLQENADIRATEPHKLGLEGLDVFSSAHEGHSDDFGVCRHDFEVADVFINQS